MMDAQQIAEQYLVLQAEVGSTAHGTGIPGEEDIDLLGVCLEPKECVYGLREFTHHRFRARPEGERSQPGDVEGVTYSLRRFCGLAATGNPSLLTLLFVHPRFVRVNSAVGDRLRDHRKMFLSKHAIRAHLGYLESQFQALKKDGGGKDVKRPELVEKYGYDCKFAAHAVRLGLQGQELAETGWISIPMKEKERDIVLAVRKGEVPYEQALLFIDSYKSDLAAALGCTTLPDDADYQAINRFLVDVYSVLYVKKYV
jgi:predicted nucleotidyltransferase